MNNKKLFVTSILIFIVVFSLDYLYYEQITFHDGAPNFSPLFIFRSLTLFFATYLFSTAVENKTLQQVEKEGFLNGKLNRIGLSIGIMFTIYFCYLLVCKKELFEALTKEDSIIEYSSALLAFLSSVLLLFSYYKFFRKAKNKNLVFRVLILTIAFGLFLIAMEEISWFQRIIDFKTPESFALNDQGEFNLHNFRTGYVELTYYFMAFIFFLFIPYVSMNTEFIKKRGLEMLVPNRAVLVIGALSCAFTYDMWNIAFMQIAFYGSILILWQLSKKDNL